MTGSLAIARPLIRAIEPPPRRQHTVSNHPDDHSCTPKPDIYEIGRPDWVLDAPVPSDHGVDVTTAYPIQNTELLAEIGPGIIGGTVTVDDKS